MQGATWAGVKLSASCFGRGWIVFWWGRWGVVVRDGMRYDGIRWVAVGYGCAVLARSTEQST